MEKKWIALLVAVAFVVAASGTAIAGKIVLANDEWTLANSGYVLPNDPGQFASNMASWFTGGGTGNFLAYSTNFGLTGSQLRSSLETAGHTWTVTTILTLNLTTLQSYDGVFLAGDAVDNSLLISYVNSGGNVYLAGGTGVGGSVAEAARWNTFLNAFGLGFGMSYNGVSGSIPIGSGHPIFANVDHLYQNNGSDALDIFTADPVSQVLVSQGGHGLYAVYESPSVPEPATLLLLGSGLIGLVGVRRPFQR